MNRTPVKSSFIDSIGYKDGWMEVAYKDGKVYKYVGIPPDLHQSVMGAESIGRAFRANILEGGFGVEKVQPETGETE